MLPKSQRLTTKEFTTYFSTGKRHHFPHVTIVYTPQPTFRGAVVVGKKVAKTAVRRNLLRRRVYHLLWQAVRTSEASGVYIVLVKPSFATLPRKAAAAELAANIAAVVKTT